MKIKALLPVLIVVLIGTSCAESTVDVEETRNEEQPEELIGSEDDGRGAAYEAFMNAIDTTAQLEASTLYYSKPNGESYQVYLLLDEESNINRMEARYTKEGSSSVLRTFFYYKEGVKHATHEFYTEGVAPNEQFKERISYYDEKGVPIITKIRSAQFEEALENELFRIVDPFDCSDARAYQAIENQGEFETTFLSTLSRDGVIYLNVGDSKQNGFTSSLVVQEITPLVQQMIHNPDAYEGKEVSIKFSELPDGSGFTFQALHAIQLAR